jgi:hypothetical protein
MDKEEFEFWQRAYLAALSTLPAGTIKGDVGYAEGVAYSALAHYRTAKAQVVQTTYATRD